jgi:hypothetical protein
MTKISKMKQKLQKMIENKKRSNVRFMGVYDFVPRSKKDTTKRDTPATETSKTCVSGSLCALDTKILGDGDETMDATSDTWALKNCNLFRHQEECVEWYKRIKCSRDEGENVGGIIGLPQGLGKTISLVACIMEERNSTGTHLFIQHTGFYFF